jgi:hypothetical protein
MASRSSSGSGASGPDRKDRLIQTRVAQDLETTLKTEAQRRRLSVSHLIRNVLEDAFDLVDDVVSDVDQIVADSVHLARNVGRNARRIVGSRDPVEASDPEPPSALAHVLAWNEVVLNRPVTCAGCGDEISRGARGFTGLCDDPGAERAWLCSVCVEAL